MKMIYAIEQLPKKEDTWVFLGGPIQGAPSSRYSGSNLDKP
jgi:hypothetical protein